MYWLRYNVARFFVRLASWIVPTSKPNGMVFWKHTCNILRNF